MSGYGVRKTSTWERIEHVVTFRNGERKGSAKSALDYMPEHAELKDVELDDDGEIRLIFESERPISPAEMLSEMKNEP